MNNPTVQIIIPVYKAASTLPKCLDSLKEQTFKDWQALLINDASPDNSEDIILDYAKEDDRFNYIKLEKNGGPSAARNKGLEIASSEYIAFLDSDDYWEPSMLEILYNNAKEYDTDVVQSKFIYDFPNGRQIFPGGAFKESVFLDGKDLKKAYVKMMTGINMNHVWMKLIKLPLVKDMRFDTSYPTGEDLEFCLRLFKKVKRYRYVNEGLYHYCRWETSITGKGLGFKKKLNCNRRISRKMLKALPYWNMNTPAYRALVLMRPYIIMVSKAFRSIREKLYGK